MRIPRNARSMLLCAALLTLAAPPVAADVILAPGSTWEYTFTDPGAGWNTTTGGWATGPAPFGNYLGGSYDPAGDFNYRTLWPADGADGYDLWVRTSINLTNFDLASVLWGLGVDNGFALYANGVLIAAANGEGYTYRWEYSGGFAPGVLNQGLNVIAVALEDHGGLTAFDMQITGTPSVPEPTTMLLLGTGLVGMAVLRRRRR